MRQEEFENHVHAQVNRSVSMLTRKNASYSGGGDKLAQFRKAADLRQTDMHDVLAGFMLKHTISLYDMLERPITSHTEEEWNEKISDHINYLLILQAVLADERSYLSKRDETDPETMAREEALLGPNPS